MDLRQAGIAAKNQEEGKEPTPPAKKTNYFPDFEGDGTLFDQDRDRPTYLGAPKHKGNQGYIAPKYDRKPIEKDKPGTLRIEMKIPVSALGKCADIYSPEFDENEMLNQAETAALDILEDFAGKSVNERYDIAFDTDEEVDEILVTATLTPFTKA